LNHRGALTAWLELAGVAASQPGEALIALDKLDKVGVEGVRRELEARGIPAAARFLDDFAQPPEPAAAEPPARSGNDAVLRRLRARVGESAVGRTALDELEAIVELTSGGSAGSRLRVDPSLARGLSYYTGAIMELGVPELAGSLGGGGRYDSLVGMFLGRDVPACGISLGLERIIVVMTERGMFPPELSRCGVDAMVTLWDEPSRADALALANELRTSGLRVEVYPESDKLSRQFKYASSRGTPFVAIVGDDERVRGQVSLKDLRTGAQQAVPRAHAATAVRGALQTA
jgi:histidyl-tRNA synthetase